MLYSHIDIDKYSSKTHYILYCFIRCLHCLSRQVRLGNKSLKGHLKYELTHSFMLRNIILDKMANQKFQGYEIPMRWRPYLYELIMKNTFIFAYISNAIEKDWNSLSIKYIIRYIFPILIYWIISQNYIRIID